MPKPTSPTEFVPTGIVNLSDLLAGVVEPDQIQQPAPPVPDPSPEPQPPAPEDNVDLKSFVPDNAHLQNPDPPAPTKPKNDAIREQLKKVAAERAKYEEEFKAERVQREKERLEYEKQREEYEALRKEHEALTVRASATNPLTHPEVRKLTEPWNQRIPGLATQLRESGMKVNNLDQFLVKAVQEYANAGDPDTDEFVEKMDSIRDAVEGYTSTIRRDSDKISAQEKIMSMIRDGAGVSRQVQSALQEMQSNAPVFHFKEQMAVYETEAREYEQVERELFNPTEDLRMGDPLHQKVILRAMIDGSEEVKKAAQNAKQFGKLISLPLRPLNPTELGQLDPERQQAAVTTHQNRYIEARKRAVKLIPEALVAYALLPAMWNELETLRKRVAGEREVPRPNNQRPGKAAEIEEDADIKEFQPIGVDPKTLAL